MNYIPLDHNHVSPYLVVENPSNLINFLVNVFSAKEIYRHETKGRIHHAEIKIVDSVIMTGQVDKTGKTTSSTLHVYVEDADEVMKEAIKNGATPIQSVKHDGIAKDRRGMFMGPEGNLWAVATHQG